MTDVEQLAALIAEEQARWIAPIVAAIFDTTEPATLAEVLVDAAETAVGEPVVSASFFRPGVGVVVGVQVADGRDIVLKVHRATYVSRARLEAIVRIQAALAAASSPAPAPVAGPVPLHNGWLTVEEFRPGDTADGYDRDVRRGIAEALWAFVDSARPHAGDAGIGRWLGAPPRDHLWPEPHDVRFDFPGTAAGAEWIDEAAGVAKATLASTDLPDVVGHLDWRVENLGFADKEVVAIYDWDSLGLVSEATLVGTASVAHPVDWRLDLPDPLPTLDQVDDFVAAYETTRGAAFTDEEARALRAGQLWLASYGARCQHSDDILGLFPDVDHSLGWPRLLRELLDRPRPAPTVIA